MELEPEKLGLFKSQLSQLSREILGMSLSLNFFFFYLQMRMPTLLLRVVIKITRDNVCEMYSTGVNYHSLYFRISSTFFYNRDEKDAPEATAGITELWTWIGP